jgi:hypothetical protein
MREQSIKAKTILEHDRIVAQVDKLQAEINVEMDALRSIIINRHNGGF